MQQVHGVTSYSLLIMIPTDHQSMPKFLSAANAVEKPVDEWAVLARPLARTRPFGKLIRLLRVSASPNHATEVLNPEGIAGLHR